MTMDDLPDHTLLRIIKYLSLPEVEAISSTARRFHTLSSAQLAHHRALETKYRAVVLTNSVEGGITHPARLLYEIWQEPSISQYIKYITFVCEDHYSIHDWSLDTTSINEETWGIIRSLDKVQDLYQRSLYWRQYEGQLQTCLDGLQDGRQSDAFVLLLFLLPNLERLRFSQPRWDKELLSSIFLCPDSRVLQKLSTVESYRSDTEWEDPIDELALFALAPSVRTLKGIRIAGDATTISPSSTWNSAVSSLTRLELSASAVGPEALRVLLLPLRYLRELRYCHHCYSIGEEIFDIATWVDIIAENIGDMLEVLSLSNPGGATTTVKSLHSLKKLRELEIEVQSLIIDEDDEVSLESNQSALDTGFHETELKEDVELVPRLVDVLPPTIELITLLIGGHEDETILLLRDIATEKHRCLPRLSKLTYGGRTLNQEVKDELKSAGIAIGRKKRPFNPKHIQFWEDDPPIPAMRRS